MNLIIIGSIRESVGRETKTVGVIALIFIWLEAFYLKNQKRLIYNTLISKNV